VYPVGHFELTTSAHPFGLKALYHAVSIVYKVLVDDEQQVKLDKQSIEWKYSKELPSDFHINKFQKHEAVNAKFAKREQ